jgi:hypothetical protein
MRFMEVPQRLQQLLQQPDPLVIHHMIKWDNGPGGGNEESNKNTACYDVSSNILCRVAFKLNFCHPPKLLINKKFH